MRRNRPNTIRIIGGRWRSRIIAFPDSEDLRPTPDRVRETLFNWLGQTLPGLACLDLFAGSGALGFESLSRGAASVVMVENDPRILKALHDNARKLGAANLTIVRGDALEFARCTPLRFDVVFVDPPYRSGLHAPALTLVRDLLNAGSRVYVEMGAAVEHSAGWMVLKQARAGAVRFYLLGRQPDDQGGISGNV